MRLWPFRYPTLRIAQPGGLPECPYFYRTVLDFRAFAIRLHWWNASDDQEALHDHPYWFLTMVLWGAYDDLSEHAQEGDSRISLVLPDRLRIGSIRFRRASHKHTVKIKKRPTITLLITGPNEHRWGFWVGKKRFGRDKYFAEIGHHPCDPVYDWKPRIRMKPDGTRIN